MGLGFRLQQEKRRSAAAAAHDDKGRRTRDEDDRQLFLGRSALALLAFGSFPFGSLLDLVVGHARVP